MNTPERKVFIFFTADNHILASRSELEKLLNDGWNINHATAIHVTGTTNRGDIIYVLDKT